MPLVDSSRTSYRNTCLECRRRKRACDKARPSCSRCERAGRTCIYNDEAATGSTEDFRRLQAQVVSLEQTVARLTAVSSAYLRPSQHLHADVEEGASNEDDVLRFMYFLDSGTFRGRRYCYPMPNVPLAATLVDALGSEYEAGIPRILERYFSTVHLWLPIIARVRLQRRIPTSSVHLKSGTALLLLCIKLVGSDPSAEADGDVAELYHLARQTVVNLSIVILPSLELLQAAILVAVFELGHAMYPAALLSVGQAISLANTMGFDGCPTSTTMLGPPQNAAELEERKRTHWAVLLLDRFVILGGHGRPLQTREPGLRRPLPCNDAQFDAGEFALSSTIGTIQSSNSRQSSFARTCQVAHLLGSVKVHLDSQEIEEKYHGAEGLQLHRTITALATLIQDELDQDPNCASSGLWSSLGLCLSTLMMLYEGHCHVPETSVATSNHQEMQAIAAEGLRKTTKSIADYSQRLKAAIEQSGQIEVSVFACECIFSAASTCVWYVGESGEVEALQMLANLRDLLKVIQTRWRTAGRMLETLSWQEKAFER